LKLLKWPALSERLKTAGVEGEWNAVVRVFLYEHSVLNSVRAAAIFLVGCNSISFEKGLCISGN
jgi:hypothetical protein